MVASGVFGAKWDVGCILQAAYRGFMDLGRLSIAALAAVGAATAWPGELTPLPPAGGAGVERGVALLRCSVPGSVAMRMSRATVLEVGEALAADVLLTTAHGLPPSAVEIERDCRVLVKGEEYAIEAVWQAASQRPGPEHDWTVVLLDERIPGDLVRWRATEIAPSWLDELVAARAPVRLVLRYADAAQTDCELESWTPQRLLAHSCLTYPGTSGSPLVVGVDSTAMLIAIHVGSELRFDGTRFDMVSVARPLDESVIAAIESASAGAPRQQDKRRRRP
jgi:hypothetical protein